MQKFDESNIVTLYIKQLLSTFNLPQCQAWVSGMQVYKDAFYIHDNVFARCLNTGTFDTFDITNFKVVYDNYKFGREILNITKKLPLNSLNYDTDTHNYLGDYLRFYRDYKGIDLMSLYNCFSNNEVSNLKIVEGKNTILANEDGYKVYAINIVPFKEYTIFIDSPIGIECACGFYENNLIDIYQDSSVKFPYSATYRKYSDLSFNKPVVYDGLSISSINKWTDETKANIVSYETYIQRENLKLFIKVPAAVNTSSIVILEGNYKNNTVVHFDGSDSKVIDNIISRPYVTTSITPPVKGEGEYDAPYFDSEGNLVVKQTLFTQQIGNDLFFDVAINIDYPVDNLDFDQNYDRPYISKLGLVKLQTGTSYPFSLRLIEYLFNNTITPDDEIDMNINKVQKTLMRRKDEDVKLYKTRLKGYWDKALRNVNYGVAKESGLIDNRYDILGYVDKDVESVINLEDNEYYGY